MSSEGGQHSHTALATSDSHNSPSSSSLGSENVANDGDREDSQHTSTTLPTSNSRKSSPASESPDVMADYDREGSIDSDATDDNPQENFELLYTPRANLVEGDTALQNMLLYLGQIPIFTGPPEPCALPRRQMAIHQIQSLSSESRVRPARDWSEAVPWYRRAMNPNPLNQTLSVQLFPSAEERGWTTSRFIGSARAPSRPERRPRTQPQPRRAGPGGLTRRQPQWI